MKSFPHVIFITISLTTGLMLGCSAGSAKLENIEDAGESTPIEQAPSVPDATNPDMPEAELSPDAQEQVQAESVRVQIDFNITVPVYQSNELLVEVSWGDTVVFADWSGDELWSVSVDLPSATENSLSITFYDNNGDLVLGRYEAPYRVDIESAETFYLTAEQFDTESWDDDSDGRSNLDEVLTGTNPRLDGTLVLEVWNTTLLPSNIFMSEYFSRRLPSERPYSFSDSEIPIITENSSPPWGGPTKNIDIAIDENGAGTFDNFYQYRPLDTSTQSATRSTSATSTIWEGEWNSYEGWDVDSYSIKRNFRSEVTNTGENTRSYTGEVSWVHYFSAYYSRTTVYETDFDLIGKRDEDSSLCIPVEGSVAVTYSYRSSDPSVESRSSRTTISKSSMDQYWKVKIVDLETENVTSEYYARSLESNFGQGSGQLGLMYPPGPELQGRFKCVF